MKTAIAAVLFICIVGVAHADVLYPNALTFAQAYAIVPPPDFFSPSIGAPLFIAGTVTAVAGPFADLVPGVPYELTFVVSGATCSGIEMWDDFSCQRGGTAFSFAGGELSVYLDTTPDADFMTPATFEDGELVLLAQTQYLHVIDDDPDGICLTVDYPDVTISLSFSGGSWYHRVGNGSSSFVEGETSYYPWTVPDELRAVGYVLGINGAISVFGPVATEPTTWGRVKSLYR